jgi:hypothetical protein
MGLLSYDPGYPYVEVTDFDGRSGYIHPDVKRAIENMVPWEWQHLFCSCYSSDGVNTSDVCSRCNRIKRYRLAYCIRCATFKPWGFFHHKQHTGDPYAFFRTKDYRLEDVPKAYRNAIKAFCWDCLVEAYGTIEGDVPPSPELVPRKTQTVEEFMADTTDPFDGFDF